MLFLIAALAPAEARAQGGTVAGRVADQSGGVLPGVTVDLHSGPTELTAVTDTTGNYRFDNVPIGPAELTFKLINFSIVRRDLTIAAGQPITVDAVLRVSLSADIVVNGWNGEIGCGLGRRARVTLEVFNLFDSDVSDIDYFHTSRLPGEPLEGVDDIHLHPSLPRAARVAFSSRFRERATGNPHERGPVHLEHMDAITSPSA